MADPSLRESLDPRRFFNGGKALPGPLALTHRRVFILPNRRGLGLSCLLFIQLIASINYNNNLGFILTFLVGGIATLGTLYGFRNLAGLSLSPGQPNPVFAGDAAHLTLNIDNPTQTPRISIHAGFRHGPQQELNLAPGESMAVVLTFESSRRGWLELPTVTLSSVFPLGLFQVWSPVRFNRRTLVYPRPSPDNIPFPPSPGGEGGLMHAAEDDFHGFQRYQPGDSMRKIHWKGVAKGQGVQVKEYRGEESSLLYLDWLQTPGFDAEARLSRLCRWVLEAEKRGGAYGLRLPGTDIKPSSGQAHLRVCLERLALFGIPG
jgi:uncharacterized protein (DUF58 family)